MSGVKELPEEILLGAVSMTHQKKLLDLRLEKPTRLDVSLQVNFKKLLAP